MSDSLDKCEIEPISFEKQLEKELQQLDSLRTEDAPGGEPADHTITRAHRMRLMGLAFSGGGIRSATFNLGVIQALAKLRGSGEKSLLSEVDYLSTVSGGGYIGGWLSNLVYREKGVAAVEKSLAEAECCEVAWLRNYSNYLTPRTGLLSTDTLQGVATYVRNVFLNQTPLIAFLSLLLLPPWMAAIGWRYLLNAPQYALPVALIGGALMSIGTLWLGYRSALVACSDPAHGGCSYAPKGIASLYMLGGFLVSGAAVALGRPDGGDLAYLLAGAALLYAAFWIAGWLLFWCSRALTTIFPKDSGERKGSSLSFGAHVAATASAFAGGAALGGGLWLYLWLIHWLAPDVAKEAVNLSVPDMASLHVAALGLPAVSMALLTAMTLHLGLAGRSFPESLREWWGRFGGLLLLANLGWIALAASAIYSPYWLQLLQSLAAAGGLVWLATTIGGALAGASSKTGKKEDGNRWIELLARVAPIVFVAGLLVAVSGALYLTGRHFLLNEGMTCEGPPASSPEAFSKNKSYELDFGEAPTGGWPAGATIYEVKPKATFDFATYACQFGRIFEPPHSALPAPLSSWPAIALVLSAAGLLALTIIVFGPRIDINFFSLHMFYRNRLERGYLGAAERQDRRPDIFTDFDPEDSPPLAALAQRPFPILNTTLNITRSSNLAWQERKAASFTFTPLYCGFEVREKKGELTPGYRRTKTYGEASPLQGGACAARNGAPQSEIRLAMPMTISGAAVSPNRGFHTSPATAFLMTMFNVRLGWWMPNPRYEEPWRNLGPKFGFARLILELLGYSRSDSNFVYLSDGGNFENLGVYELVRRRCRYIIVCDAGCDPTFQFEDVGNALRKIRIDLGIEIDLDARPLIPDPTTGRSLFHCVVGKIHYDRVDGANAPRGYLLYMKPSLNGVEPGDVLQYAAANKTFPHETTGDQWFSESQFEAYRKLGEHVACTVLKADWEDAECNVEKLFHRLEERWYAPSPSVKGAFSKHGDAVNRLFKRLYEDENLRFMDAQFYPQWPYLLNAAKSQGGSAPFWGSPLTKPALLSALPTDPEKIRASFYFCNELFQLMENVYMDLNLEAEADHPDNRGWINLFHNWSWSPMFRVAWSISASCYGARFQTFCKRRLGMDIGKAVLAEKESWKTLIETLAVGKPLIFEGRPVQADGSERQINPVEWDIVQQLSTEPEFAQLSEKLLVVPLRLQVLDPLKMGGTDVDAVMFSYPFGVALVLDEDGGKLKFYRVQDHLQRIGLGGEGLRALRKMWPALELAAPDDVIKKSVAGANPERLRSLWDSVCAGSSGSSKRDADNGDA